MSDEQTPEQEPVPQGEEEEQYELTPDACNFDPGGSTKPAKKAPPKPDSKGSSFQRKKVLMALCIGFAVIIGGGFMFNIIRSDSQKKTEQTSNDRVGRMPSDIWLRELEQAETQQPEDGAALLAEETSTPASVETRIPENELPSFTTVNTTPPPAPPRNYSTGASSGGGGYSGPDPLAAARLSPLVPKVEGRLFSGGSPPATAQSSTSQNPYLAGGYPYQGAGYQNAASESLARMPAPYTGPADPYLSQNNQENKQGFFDSGQGGNPSYLDDKTLWIGTVIPAILITEINTDLPGNIMARTTENVYDSKTGLNLLIPQGATLLARYNSSVSYAQKRVQIVWDTLIRPDGLMLQLEGANGIDRKGMAGVKAEYHENWFEYLKAAGIITMFSVANSRMTEEVAKYSGSSTAGSVAQSNADFVNQLGSGIVARAQNIQPTLTVANGTIVEIMLNRILYLPPIPDYPVSDKYTLR